MQRLECVARSIVPPRPKWISDTMWRQCQHLEISFEDFDKLCLSIINNHNQWQAFYLCDDPYKLMNNKYNSKEHTFGKKLDYNWYLTK